MSVPDTSTLAGKIQVMQAAMDGKPIQILYRSVSTWRDVSHPEWNWALAGYRIKPQAPLRCWQAVYVDGYMRGRIGWIESQTAEQFSSADRHTEMIELTPEVEAALVAAGIIGGDA